ncbi:hypothetical protein [Micromonospora aurantiaca (nom. illeg.)]|uniref:hypothetical protein n=1 Tax=Micromonospora aurantiaca (nom. illeg.) TaxID=47850 RepID=UPI00030A1F0D|nr:hypothetical protein [Micromonospora aurantiaca]
MFNGAACLVFAVSGLPQGWLAAAALMVATLLQVLGELKHSAGGWGISFDLAPDHAHGQYQAAHSTGAQFGRMIAPAVLTWLTLDLGWKGLGRPSLVPHSAPGCNALSFGRSGPRRSTAATRSSGESTVTASTELIPACGSTRRWVICPRDARRTILPADHFRRR